MAFLGHHPCPSCNSRNNLGEWDNGFYCFGCGYRKIKRDLSRFKPVSTEKVMDGITLTKNLPKTALKWLLGYNLTQNEMDSFHYAHTRIIKNEEVSCNLLVLYYDGNYWLARNFDDNAVNKYLSSGNKPFITYGQGNIAVFVEDIISAIKVGRQFTAIPMLGATIPTEWWTKVKNYDKVVIWGDRDKAKNNVIASRKARELIGKQVDCIITDKDPKNYSDNDIYNYIIK
ncbi:MAG: hypothetical protein RLY40_995 [Pseudomonadota bacterium]|jgi:hypothetical protein